MSFLRKKKHGSNGHGARQGSGEFVLDDEHQLVLNFRGLVPVVLQDIISDEVLHLGYMDRWALNSTLEEKTVYYYRRSSGRLEKFGEKKGLEYEVKSIKLDRSRRSILMKVLSRDESTVIESSFIHEIEVLTER